MMGDDEEEDDNSMGVGRYPVMPSLVALQQMRNRLQLATLGRKLMKWTMLATGKKLRRVSIKLFKNLQDYGNEFREAYMLLARCRYHYPPINEMVKTNVVNRTTHIEVEKFEEDTVQLRAGKIPVKKARVTVCSKHIMVSGVRIVKFEVRDTGIDPNDHLGMGVGGQMIAATKEAWHKLLLKVILIVEHRKAFQLIINANLSATKRLRVLRSIVVPKTVATVRYILDEIDEQSREEYYRFKKVLDMCKKLEAAKLKRLLKHRIEEPESISPVDNDKTEIFTAENKDECELPIANEINLEPTVNNIDQTSSAEKVTENLDESNVLPDFIPPPLKIAKSNVDVSKEPTTSSKPKLQKQIKFEDLKGQLTEILKVTKDMEGSLFMKSCVRDFLEIADFLKNIIGCGEGADLENTSNAANTSSAPEKIEENLESEVVIEETESDVELDSFRLELNAYNILNNQNDTNSKKNISAEDNFEDCNCNIAGTSNNTIDKCLSSDEPFSKPSSS